MAKQTQGSVRLRAWMKKTGTTQEQVAEQIKASQQSVSSWLAGQQQPRIPHALALEKLAKIPIKDWAADADESGTSVAATAKAS